MKIKKGLFSTEIEFTKKELLDKKFIKKVKKEVIVNRVSILQQLVEALSQLGLRK